MLLAATTGRSGQANQAARVDFQIPADNGGPGWGSYRHWKSVEVRANLLLYFRIRTYHTVCVEIPQTKPTVRVLVQCHFEPCFLPMSSQVSCCVGVFVVGAGAGAVAFMLRLRQLDTKNKKSNDCPVHRGPRL